MASASGEGGGVGLQPVEEGTVADQRRLHRLGEPGDVLAPRQGVEQVQIGDHRMGWGEAADEVLGAEGVDAVLHPHRRVVLGEHGGGEAHHAHAPMHRGRGQPRHVEQRAAAHREQIAVTVDPRLGQRLDHLAQRFGAALGVGLDASDQRRVGRRQTAVHHHQQAGGATRTLLAQGVDE